MTAFCSSRSTYGALAIRIAEDVDSVSDFTGTDPQFEYIGESLSMQQQMGGGQGIRGSRSHNKSRVRILAESISGGINIEPTANELKTLLFLAMGGGSTSATALAETLDNFGVCIDRIAKRFTYKNCKINRFQLSGSAGQPVSCAVEVEGESEIVEAGAFPSVAAIDGSAPYIFSDATISLAADASATQIARFTLAIDNGLDTGRYMNSVTRDCLDPTDRRIGLSLSIPYNADSVDLHDQSVAGASGTLTLTQGTTFAFTMGNLKSPAQSPVTSRRGEEVFLELNMVAYCTSANDELSVTIS